MECYGTKKSVYTLRLRLNLEVAFSMNLIIREVCSQEIGVVSSPPRDGEYKSSKLGRTNVLPTDIVGFPIRVLEDCRDKFKPVGPANQAQVHLR